MKTFFNEFKKFIMRGNVLDLAVGVIIGSAFTAIVSALTDNILKPLINWIISLIFGKEGFSDVYTYLIKTYNTDGSIDLTNSIFIDWGAFASSIINFFLIAVVLFIIVKSFNSVKDKNESFKKKILGGIPTRSDYKEMKKLGIKRSDFKAIDKFMENKKQALIEEKKQKELEEEQAKIKERLENPTTEDLLKDIKELLMKNQKQ